MSNSLSLLRYLLFPRCCAGCGRPDQILCPSCTDLFYQWSTSPLHDYYDHSSPDCPACLVYACSTYDDCVRQAILAWKDHGDEELDKPFSQALCDLLASVLEILSFSKSSKFSKAGKSVLLVPAPSTQASFYRRGRAQLIPLCRAAERNLQSDGFDLRSAPVLSIDGSSGKAVAHNDRRSRLARLAGRIRISSPASIQGHPVILLDDIVTTGSTLRSCQAVIEEAGGCVVAAVVLSSRPRQ